MLNAPVAWLVDLALNLHYADHAHSYNEPVDPWHGRCLPVVDGAARSPTVAQALAGLLRTLHLPDDGALLPSPVDGALVAADIVRHIVSDVATTTAAAASDAQRDDPRNDCHVQVDQVPLGFSTGDDGTDRIATIMRLLHVRQLRSLQDDINNIIADMQALTANPQTNSKLGKVGW